MMGQMKYDVFKVVDGQRIHKGNYSDLDKAVRKAQKVLDEKTNVHVIVEGYDDYKEFFTMRTKICINLTGRGI